ncbi:MAG TPA: hypothetical protein VIX80_07235 [Candidatus Kapabacteria bacterium]
MSSVLTIVLLSVICVHSFAQELKPPSVGSAALAYSDIVSRSGNVFAINPSSIHTDSITDALASVSFSPFKGGLGNAVEYGAGLSYTHSGISTSVGVSFVKLGYDELFSDQRASLSLSHHFSPEKLRRASLGARARFETIGFTSEYEKIHRFLIDFGGEMLFTDELAVGFMTLNLLGASTNTVIEEEKVPRTYSLGIEYSPRTTGLALYTTLEKQTERDLLARFGVGYSPFSFITLRTGITSAFESYHFGFGVHTNGIIVEGAFVMYSQTGESLSVGLSYAW